MIELLYFASQIQCTADIASKLDIQVDVSHNGELIKTMSVNETVLLDVDSIQDLTFEYKTVGNAACGLSFPSEKVLASDDDVPTIPGLYEQTSIQNMLDGLETYEELLLVELGTDDKTSLAFDLQDVVIKVNNEPTIATLFAD